MVSDSYWVFAMGKKWIIEWRPRETTKYQGRPSTRSTDIIKSAARIGCKKHRIELPTLNTLRNVHVQLVGLVTSIFKKAYNIVEMY